VNFRIFDVITMAKRPIHRLIDGGTKPEYDDLADESIITIFNEQEVIVRILATPQNLEDLAVGHIKCEGRGNVDNVVVNGTDITVEGDVIPRPTNDLLTAACGACTVGEIQIPDTMVSRTQFLTADFKEMMSNMKQNQPIFDSTGGVHAAAIFSQTGECIVVREDIGRHNAFDKVVGASICMNIEPKIIGLSGRVGWELVAKAVRSNIEIILAIGAISSAAEALARNAGITMVGFASKQNPVLIGPLSRIIDKQNATREV